MKLRPPNSAQRLFLTPSHLCVSFKAELRQAHRIKNVKITFGLQQLFYQNYRAVKFLTRFKICCETCTECQLTLNLRWPWRLVTLKKKKLKKNKLHFAVVRFQIFNSTKPKSCYKSMLIYLLSLFTTCKLCSSVRIFTYLQETIAAAHYLEFVRCSDQERSDMPASRGP